MGNRVICGDCLQVLPTLADNSVNLIATDPPYFGVKSEDWDNQWKTKADFLSWLGLVLDQFQRVLKPNGSLYLFMSPAMSYDVEGLIRERFHLLNRISWRKHDGTGFDTGAHSKVCKDDLRSYFPQTETIFFAEHYGSDNIAKGEAGYIHGPSIIGDSIRRAREAVSMKGTDVDIALGYVRTKDSRRGTELCRRWEEGSSIPSEQDYCRALQACGDRREYEDLRREYEDLRREYEDLRRPFNGSSSRPYTDVWDFATVASYPGKHPCEKPADLCAHIIETSSRPGDVVLDSFAGSGVMLQAARLLGRQFIGIEGVRYWADRAATRAQAQRDITTEWQPVNARRKQRTIVQTDLFAAMEVDQDQSAA